MYRQTRPAQGLTAGDGPLPAVLRQFSPAALGTAQMIPVVVEFHQPPAVVYRLHNPLTTEVELQAYAEQLRRNHRQFIAQLQGLGMDVRISNSTAAVAGAGGFVTEETAHDFTYLFNGIGLLLPGRLVQQMAGLPGVRAITYNVERVYLNLEHSVPFTGAPQVWRRTAPGGDPLMGQDVTVAVIDTGALATPST